MLMVRELLAVLNIALVTEPPVILKGTHCPLAAISPGAHPEPIPVIPPVSST